MGTSKGAVIENAADVIERFGGIRPMAKKMDVAVTTVQGWKKRDVIPAARRQQVMDAAAAHDVDLAGVLEGASVANENVEAVAPIEEKVEELTEEIRDLADVVEEVLASEPETQAVEEGAPVAAPVEKPSLAADPLDRKLAATEKRAVAKSAWITIVLLALGLFGVVALLWPKQSFEQQEAERISALEQGVDQIQSDVKEVKSKQSFFGTLIPEDLGAQLSDLQEQTGITNEKIGAVLEKAQAVSTDVLGSEAGSIEERLEKLEGHVGDVMSGASLAGFMDRVDTMEADQAGQSKLESVMGELGALVRQGDDVDGTQSPLNFQEMLANARNSSPELAETFSGVPATELKAAAMLLGMSQFRSSLNRDNQAFDSDLSVLMKLVDEDDVELRDALARLAPHAKEGVLTPSGLTSEFKGIAGDAVVASLSGEDVSLSERTSARFNQVFTVEKDGELVTGTETQGTLQKAESLLEQGDIEGAIAAAQSIDGPAADILAPWLKKAEVSVMARKLKKLLGNSMTLKAYGLGDLDGLGGLGGLGDLGGAASDLGEAGLSIIPGQGTLIRDEATGINVLKPSRGPEKILDDIKDIGK